MNNELLEFAHFTACFVVCVAGVTYVIDIIYRWFKEDKENE